MMNVVFNRNMIAMPRRWHPAPGTIPIEPYEMFGTPYGMFIPFTLSGVQFIRWVKKGMEDVLPKQCVLSYFLHISNDGEVLVMYADTEENVITMTPYQSEVFNFISGERELSEAYKVIVAKCETIAEAVKVVDEGEPKGLFEPIIFFVDDWVKYAKEKGYTETFYYTEFPGARPGKKKP